MAKKTITKKANTEDHAIRIRVAGILTNSKNEILLVNHQKHGKSYWLLPGGGVEHGETLDQALKREFEEELSMKNLKVGELLLANDSIYPDGSRHVINLYFAVKSKKSANFILMPDHVLKGAAFYSVNNFRKLLFYPDVKNAIISLWLKGFKEPAGYIKTKWKV